MATSMATTHAHPNIHTFVTHDGPPSPTLTNPDMILPWQINDSSSTPLASSPTIHADNTSPYTHRNTNFDRHSSEPKTEFGVAKAVIMPFRMKPPPPTTITPTYHGYDHGAPLSDIGEEELTPRSRKSWKTRSRSPSPSVPPEPALLSEPTLKNKKRLSNKSESSVGSDIGDWENFDSSKMMNERLAADVAKAGDDMGELDGLDSKRNSLVNPADDEMTRLNMRAEQILANAKKRLTHMESNLSNARNSVLLTSKSSPLLGDFHQPVGGLYRSISQGGDRRLGQNYMRKSKPLYPVIRTVQNGHQRGMSDDSASRSSPQYSKISQIRSASALEFGRRMDSLLPDHSPKGPAIGHSPSSSRSYNSPLRILEEEDDNDSPSTNVTSPQTPATRGLGILTSSPTEDLHKRQNSNASLEPARSSSQASTRSAQVLREQMSDLKSRIADLKNKAQADTLRRQNSQSLRTSSPFTQAPEQWYAGAPEYKERGTPINTNAGLGWSPSQGNGPSFGTPRSPKDSAFGDGELVIPATAGQRSETRTDANTPTLHQKTVKLPPKADDPIPFPQGSFYQDAHPRELDGEGEDQVAASEEEQVYLNEVLEESLQDGDPGIPIMLDEDEYGPEEEAERHEDRVDAFDYENMFVHSALGNYHQRHARSRSNSDSSGETRRAAARTPIAEEEDEEEEEEYDEQFSALETNEEEPPTPRAFLPPQAPWMRAARSNSMDSVATTASFATAAEGMDDDQDSQMPSEILNWGSSIQQPALSPQQSAWPTPPMGGSRPVSRGKQMHAGTSPVAQARGVLPSPPVRSPPMPDTQEQAPTYHPANTEILMASLITLADPTFQMPTTPNAFAEIDKGLVISLLRAVGGVCDRILKSEVRGEGHEARVWRRKLDEARVILQDGSEQGDEAEEF